MQMMKHGIQGSLISTQYGSQEVFKRNSNHKQLKIFKISEVQKVTPNLTGKEVDLQYCNSC